MSTISSQEIISIIKGEIEDYDAHAGQVNETGSVIWVGDGIAIVYGIDHAIRFHFARECTTSIVSPGIAAISKDTGRSTPFKLSFRPDSGFTNKGADTRVRCSDFARERSK